MALSFIPDQLALKPRLLSLSLEREVIMAYLLHQLLMTCACCSPDNVALISGSSASLQKVVRKLMRGDKDA
jgi:hypothetical protein